MNPLTICGFHDIFYYFVQLILVKLHKNYIIMYVYQSLLKMCHECDVVTFSLTKVTIKELYFTENKNLKS